MNLPRIILLIAVLGFLAVGGVSAKLPRGIEDLGQRSQAGERLVPKQSWQGGSRISPQEKSFELKTWDKHFSPWGSKRSEVGGQKNKLSQKKFPKRSFESGQKKFKKSMASIDQNLEDLYREAGIDLSDQARLVENRQLYQRVLQDTKQPFEALKEELSLRDINRFQFRRNRTDDGVPVQAAGQDSTSE
jgi:hypothetical protein